jgi:hypothetical protein
MSYFMRLIATEVELTFADVGRATEGSLLGPLLRRLLLHELGAVASLE